ncbi:multisubunit sodium/proton antiporter, MrpB subunit [Stigmatella aurantiaca]|uniref:Multisubunit sodium/proton antiporter, MrpB subunit n=1 Tax=Stigmatella aurantiaca TaxID=41 RepID=A0A1H7PCZ8_STIAU|nr:Na+/H+ antiporter subunit B [Stigmatella aurantiaca]SEL33529.1 multisubunit sodium/proton antiporter, MrpB subunit [Stigmatella aurantiaca]
MNSVVLRAVARTMTPVLLQLSLVLLVRGHNAPGGGFVGGLMTSAALILYLIAYGTGTVRRLVRVSPMKLMAMGLAVTLGTAALPLVTGQPFLRSAWTELSLPWGGHLALGTPMLFDVGVYLVVVGATLGFILALAEGEGSEGGGKEDL